MLYNCVGILSATENKENLRSLTAHRAIASIPLAGKYRVVDFMLSNMVNSGIRTIGILTQTNSRSLRDHISTGEAWDLNSKAGGLFLFHDNRNASINNDLQILKDNQEFLDNIKTEYVIFSSTYYVANIDFEPIVKKHIETGADVTTVYKKAKDADRNFLGSDILSINRIGKVEEVAKNTGENTEENICMEIFIMSKEILSNLMEKSAYIDYARSLKSMVYEKTEKMNIMTYEHTGYVGCISSLQSYYKTNMDMINVEITKELFFNNERPIFSKSKDSVPTKYSVSSKVCQSLISNGCEISGDIKESVISRGVTIEEGAEVENSIILQNCSIKSGAKLKNVIIDKNTIIEANTILTGSSAYPLVIEKDGLK